MKLSRVSYKQAGFTTLYCHGGLTAKVNTPYGSAKLGLYADVTGQTNGLMANAQYVKPFYISKGCHTLITTPGFGVQWTQDKITNYYYGVSATEFQRTALAEYEVGSSLSPYASLGMMYRYNQRWAITAMLRVNYLSKTVQDSPMVDKSYVLTSVLSLTYSF